VQGYEPTVWVKTRKTDEGVEVIVQDNGGGIPSGIRDKIFQPFFTTKPTGEGTGLGLSMSYDIISKGHGGDLQMQTSDEEGTVFKIVLPIKKEGA
jgi:signal transduction histidine kinase